MMSTFFHFQPTLNRLLNSCAKLRPSPEKATKNPSFIRVNIFDGCKIANGFNAFFTNTRSSLTSKIPDFSKTFESYIHKPDSD